MFAPILNWVMGTGGRPVGPALEFFSSVPVGRKTGEEILSAVPRRRQLTSEIEDLLIGLPREVRPELVGRAVLRFALYVVDLPASEKNHDAQEYGLFDHSLEVARAAVGELVRPSFRVSEDPAANYREQPIWAYAGFVLGLLHDVGKALEVEVKVPPGSEVWEPLKGPLGSFLERRGRRATGPECRKWKPGRGRNEHVWKGRALFPLVLPEKSLGILGARLSSLLDVFTRSYQEGSEDWHRGPEGRIVEVVRKWDKAIAKEGEGSHGPSESTAERETGKPDKKVGKPDCREVIVLEGSGEEEDTRADEPAPRKIPLAEPSKSPPQPAAPVHAKTGRPQERNQIASVQKFSDQEHRLQVELDSSRLFGTIQGWVRAGNVNVSRNRPSAQIFVTSNHLWLRYPQAFESILRGVGIHWNGRVNDLLLQALRSLPQVEGLGEGGVLVPAIPSPQSPKPLYFVRIRAMGFLPDAELALLGEWPFEMRILAVLPARPDLGTVAQANEKGRK